MTLYLHEVHSIVGAAEDEFESIFKDEWLPAYGAADDARLLYYTNQAHGTGLSYRVVTVTAVADGGAWERLCRRVAFGDLADLALRTDALRHGVVSKMLLPAPWSPMSDIDVAAEPAKPGDHEPSLFMEDTGWPSSNIAEYLEFWEKDYHPMLLKAPDGVRLLEIQACWTTAHGSGRRPEGILWQRIHNLDALMGLYSREIPPERRAAGSYMERALTFRDQWESRLLRTAPWSPRW
jgi:hypothetical protein